MNCFIAPALDRSGHDAFSPSLCVAVKGRRLCDSGAAYRLEIPELRSWQVVQEIQMGDTGASRRPAVS
jgi:hypothetical protein